MALVTNKLPGSLIVATSDGKTQFLKSGASDHMIPAYTKAFKSLRDSGKVLVTEGEDEVQEKDSGDLSDRETIFRARVATLEAKDYTQTGKPDVDAINRDLPEGTEIFSAAERNELWEKMD